LQPLEAAYRALGRALLSLQLVGTLVYGRAVRGRVGYRELPQRRCLKGRGVVEEGFGEALFLGLMEGEKLSRKSFFGAVLFLGGRGALFPERKGTSRKGGKFEQRSGGGG